MKPKSIKSRASACLAKMSTAMSSKSPPIVKVKTHQSQDGASFVRAMRVMASVIASFPAAQSVASDFSNPSSQGGPSFSATQYVLQIDNRAAQTLGTLKKYPSAAETLRKTSAAKKEIGPMAACIKTMFDASGIGTDKQSQEEAALAIAYLSVDGIEITREWASRTERDVRIAQAAYCVDQSEFEKVIRAWDAEAMPYGKTIGEILVQYKVKQIFETLSDQDVVLSEAVRQSTRAIEHSANDQRYRHNTPRNM